MFKDLVEGKKIGMINKKNLLGKVPEQLGEKDAIHTAIVSVRAAKPIQPGEKVIMNADREAEPANNNKSCGVADPFRRKAILRGEVFWLILGQEEVPNVKHVWDHPEIDFSPPIVPPKRNKVIERHAKEYGVTYEQIMEAANLVVEKNKSTPYPGNNEEWADVEFDKWEFWDAWASETLYEFENYGSDCCPEYEYPDRDLFI